MFYSNPTSIVMSDFHYIDVFVWNCGVSNTCLQSYWCTPS